MADWSQKRDRKTLTEKKPPTSVLKTVDSAPPTRFMFPIQAPPNVVIFQLGDFGKFKTRGHQCLCKMEKHVQVQLDLFLKKAQQNMCDVDTFLKH